MSQAMRKRIHLIYGIALSAVTVIAGICLMLACYHIYTTGMQAGAQQIYSRAIVAEAFSHIAVPVYLCLALTIGSFILHLALPLEKKKPTVEKNRQLILSRLEAKTDLDGCDPELAAAIRAQTKRRTTESVICAVILAICSVIFLVYACTPGRWPEASHVTDAMLQGTLIFLACLVLPTAAAIAVAYRSRASLDTQIELMKQAAAQSPARAAAPAQSAATSAKLPVTQILRYAILAVAVVLVIVGYANGGIDDVIAKAAAICTECVGLG